VEGAAASNCGFFTPFFPNAGVLAAVEIRANHRVSNRSRMTSIARTAHFVLLNISSKRATVWL
jgi:hypothetical protein